MRPAPPRTFAGAAFLLLMAPLAELSLALTKAILRSPQTHFFLLLPHAVVIITLVGPVAIAAVLSTLALVYASIGRLLVESKLGVLGDFTRAARETQFSFSMLLSLSLFVSILLALLLPPRVGVRVASPVFVVLTGPLCEELHFRFPLLLILSLRESSRARFVLLGRSDYEVDAVAWLAMTLDAALFAVAHVFPGAWDIPKIPQAFVVGLVIAYISLKLGLIAAIAFHAIFNAISIMLVQFLLRMMSPLSLLSFFFSILMMMLSVLALMVSAVKRLIR